MKQIIETIAANHLTKWAIWKEKRLYINDTNLTMIYNTRKCKQSVYIDLKDMSIQCFTECAEQGNKWIENENQRVLDSLQSFARLLRIATGVQRFSTEPIEVVVNNALLAVQPVQGYYTEWRQERVPINRFGKLATRNRQFVIAYKGTQNDVPRGFVPLSDAAYHILAVVRGGQEMLQPYGSVPDYETLAHKLSTYTSSN